MVVMATAKAAAVVMVTNMVMIAVAVRKRNPFRMVYFPVKGGTATLM